MNPPLFAAIVQIPKPPKDHHQQKMVKTHPLTHFFSNPPLYFESTHYLSLGFLHPLGFLNFDRLNHFKHAFTYPLIHLAKI
jgi:hypothetical protein